MCERFCDNPPIGEFKPYCHYNQESDSITTYFESDADYSEQLNRYVTIYRSIGPKKIVGCRIDGVTDLLEQTGPYGDIVCTTDRIKFLLILGILYSSCSSSSRRVYDELAKVDFCLHSD